ncbi:unnamed protein product [Linum trigynum]|uniref:Uncharacterized protein n=1 Tax=Linum trigynum TaxID=586398 RepID=A0AAV2E7T3_9ROSI
MLVVFQLDGGLGADPDLLVLSSAANNQQFMTVGLGVEQSNSGGQNQRHSGPHARVDGDGQQPRRYTAAEKGKSKVVDDGKKNTGVARPRAMNSGITIQEPMSQPTQPARAASAVRDSVSSKGRVGRAGQAHPLRPKPGFNMRIGELEEMMFDRKSSKQEMMTEPESQSLPPKKLCFDANVLQYVGLENDDLLGEEEQEADQCEQELDGDGDEDAVEEAIWEWPQEDK